MRAGARIGRLVVRGSSLTHSFLYRNRIGRRYFWTSAFSRYQSAEPIGLLCNMHCCRILSTNTRAPAQAIFEQHKSVYGGTLFEMSLTANVISRQSTAISQKVTSSWHSLFHALRDRQMIAVFVSRALWEGNVNDRSSRRILGEVDVPCGLGNWESGG